MQPDKHEFWIDYNLPPKMALWLIEEFNVNAKTFKELQFETTPDAVVYKLAAKNENVIVITTKDIDFKYLQAEIGSAKNFIPEYRQHFQYQSTKAYNC